jgi:hypothetical protein
MKKNYYSYSLLLLLFCACTKEVVTIPPEKQPAAIPPPVTSNAIEYTINKGEHFCDKNIFVPVDYQALSFTAYFDSSAKYTSIAAENQYDINKLYGFSDNQAHHQEYSARFGWRWSDNALYLFAYVYNNGVRSSEMLGAVPLNTAVHCGLTVLGNQYVFTLNGKTTVLPRMAKTQRALGYKLYPYFGGDEIAPHTIRIRIDEQN